MRYFSLDKEFIYLYIYIYIYVGFSFFGYHFWQFSAKRDPPKMNHFFEHYFETPVPTAHFFWECVCTWAAHFFSGCTWAAHFFPVCTWAAHFFSRLHLGRTFLFSMQKLFAWAFSVTSFCAGISCEEGLSDCRAELFVFVGDGRQKSTGGKVQICRQYSSDGNLAKKLEQCFKTKRKPGRRSWVQPAGFGKKVPLANRKQLTEYNCRLYRFEKKNKNLGFTKALLWALLWKKLLVYN